MLSGGVTDGADPKRSTSKKTWYGADETRVNLPFCAESAAHYAPDADGGYGAES